jgi:hypothetical protein
MGMESAKIEGDEIVIRIPIAAIAHATEVACDEEYGFELHQIKVTDSSVFANEILAELVRESEDGTTRIDKMLDGAVIEAIEQGAAGIEGA